MMQVFKFGGASIRNAGAIRNMAEIIRKYGPMPLLVVVSAMGKTTRALEDFIDSRVGGNKGEQELTLIKEYHHDILNELFEARSSIFNEVDELFDAIRNVEYVEHEYGRYYDRVVSTGEMASSLIITSFLNQLAMPAQKIDATTLVKCTGNYQSGKVNWPLTRVNILEDVLPVLEEKIAVTQGFIGSNSTNDVITLGKEGSDYTAAIFSACLGAESVTIWKDVPGILSADPKFNQDTKQILQLPYTEASEMTYYGACVIHPKTIKPLANNNIPLIVRSFDDPTLTPTEIKVGDQETLEPCLIVKKNQCLFTFRVRDYTFVDEKSLARIFSTLHQFDININMMQSSAITISLCFDFKKAHVDALFQQLDGKFKLQYMTNLQLITLKNYNEDYLERNRPKSEIILEQRSRRNCRFLVRED